MDNSWSKGRLLKTLLKQHPRLHKVLISNPNNFIWLGILKLKYIWKVAGNEEKETYSGRMNAQWIKDVLLTPKLLKQIVDGLMCY